MHYIQVAGFVLLYGVSQIGEGWYRAQQRKWATHAFAGHYLGVKMFWLFLVLLAVAFSVWLISMMKISSMADSRMDDFSRRPQA